MARKFLALRDAGEARAIANKTSGRLPRGTGSVVGRFFELLGSPNDTDVGPVCNDAGGNALAWTFGLGNFTNGYGKDGATGKEDLGAARFFLFLGTNQAETHPVTFAHLLRGRAHTGARLVVVDPRRTPTAAQADEWIAPKPHTDLALALAMLHQVDRRETVRRGLRAALDVGFDELKRHILDRKVHPRMGRRRDGRPRRQNPPARRGLRAQPPRRDLLQRRHLPSVECLRHLPLPRLPGRDHRQHRRQRAAAATSCTTPGPAASTCRRSRGRSRARGPALPVGPDYFAESILSRKPYRLRAIVTEGQSAPGLRQYAARSRRRFVKLDFYVYTGLFMEESAYYADVILPVCSGLEMETVYMRRDDRAIRWQKQAVPRVGESRPDWEIWIDLAHAMARLDTRNPPEYWTENLRDGVEGLPQAVGRVRRSYPRHGRHDPGADGEACRALRWPCPDDGASRRQHPLPRSPFLVCKRPKPWIRRPRANAF